MRRLKCIGICLSLSLSLISGCETIVYWDNLPPLASPRVIRIIGDKEEIIRAVKLTQRLVDVKRLPASTIFVVTLTYYRTNVYKSSPIFDDRPRSFRCAPTGEQVRETVPPSSGCIVVPEEYLDRLSDDALAAVIAHELGHIEKGHKSWQGAAEPTLIQWEADEAAIDRLYLAGYCAGETIRKAGREIALVYARRATHPWRDYPADCKPKELKDRAIEDSALVFYKRGLGYYEKKDYDQAIEAYSQAIKLNPNHADAFNDRGNVYLNKKDYERAMQDYNEAIRLRPGYALAYFNRGLAYQNKADHERAIQDYDEAIRLNPNYAPAFRNRGLTYHRKGAYDRAIQDFDQAIVLDPRVAFVFNNRGLSYSNRKDYDLAIQDYNEAIRLNPNYALAFNNRANAYRNKRDYEHALADYEAAARIDPKAARHKLIGYTLFFMERVALSAQAMEQALKAAPRDIYAILWRYLARAKEKGMDIASRELGERAVNLNETRWPAPVVNYFLGRISENEMYAAAENSDPKKSREQICEANFYSAQAKLLRNATGEAIALLRAAEKDCPPNFFEAHGASAELRRLGY